MSISVFIFPFVFLPLPLKLLLIFISSFGFVVDKNGAAIEAVEVIEEAEKADVVPKQALPPAGQKVGPCPPAPSKPK